jgi:uncharacterized protein (TIGR03437 family)
MVREAEALRIGDSHGWSDLPLRRRRRWRVDFALVTALGFAAATGTVCDVPGWAAVPDATVSSVTPSIAVTEVVVNALGGAAVEVSLSSGGQALSGVQCDVSYPDEALSFSVSSGASVTTAAKMIWTAVPDSGVERILATGLNQNVIADGVLATLAIQMKTGAAPGIYPLTLTNVIASDPSGAPVTLSTIDGGAVVAGTGVAAPAVGAVGNAASYTGGLVAPGEIVVIFGNSFAESTPNAMQLTATGTVANSLGGTTVFFNDVPAPLLYTSANQVSAIVPYEVDGQTQTSIQVEYQGIRSAPLIVPVAPAAPGVFTLDLSGSGQGAIVNRDGTVNGPASPAARGDIVSIYGTGEGKTVPPGADGIIVTAADLCYPAQTVTVSIAGQSAEVLYAGSAGDSVAGLLQVNARIPMGIAPGSAVPVAITVGGSSQAGVTMAVQ